MSSASASRVGSQVRRGQMCAGSGEWGMLSFAVWVVVKCVDEEEREEVRWEDAVEAEDVERRPSANVNGVWCRGFGFGARAGVAGAGRT